MVEQAKQATSQELSIQLICLRRRALELLPPPPYESESAESEYELLLSRLAPPPAVVDSLSSSSSATLRFDRESSSAPLKRRLRWRGSYKIKSL
uniref:Uncharacterized protein n=1 Tax=Romanomermis culicivorax TaxID=13658 RepID=A0A915KBD7_ROMCU